MNLKKKASKSAKLSLANGKRLGREEAEKEMQGYIDELKEKASKSAKLSLANGKRLGREEAEKEMQEKSRVAMQKITQNMLKLGINLEQISEITGLTKQEIESMNN